MISIITLALGAVVDFSEYFILAALAADLLAFGIIFLIGEIRTRRGKDQNFVSQNFDEEKNPFVKGTLRWRIFEEQATGSREQATEPGGLVI